MAVKLENKLSNLGPGKISTGPSGESLNADKDESMSHMLVMIIYGGFGLSYIYMH